MPEDKKSVNNFLNMRFYLSGSDNWDLIDSNGVLIHHNSNREERYGQVEAVAMLEFPEGSRKFREALDTLYDYSNRSVPENRAREFLLDARKKWLANIRKDGREIDLAQIGKVDADFLGKELLIVFVEDYIQKIKPYISACNFSPVGFTHARITGIERVVDNSREPLAVLRVL